MKDETSRDSLAVLQTIALLTVVFGAIGSIGLLRHAQQHPPPLIVAGFVVWVLAPFGLLGIANLRSKRWPIAVRKTLYVSTLIITAASLAIYVDDSIAHRTAHPAGVWVAVPVAAVIISAIVIGLAAAKRSTK
jgi:peptidoglycan/LPS O-acetylase OafA/YrhL